MEQARGRSVGCDELSSMSEIWLQGEGVHVIPNFASIMVAAGPGAENVMPKMPPPSLCAQRVTGVPGSHRCLVRAKHPPSSDRPYLTTGRGVVGEGEPEPAHVFPPMDVAGSCAGDVMAKAPPASLSGQRGSGLACSNECVFKSKHPPSPAQRGYERSCTLQVEEDRMYGVTCKNENIASATVQAGNARTHMYKRVFGTHDSGPRDAEELLNVPRDVTTYFRLPEDPLGTVRRFMLPEWMIDHNIQPLPGNRTITVNPDGTDIAEQQNDVNVRGKSINTTLSGGTPCSASASAAGAPAAQDSSGVSRFVVPDAAPSAQESDVELVLRGRQRLVSCQNCRAEWPWMNVVPVDMYCNVYCSECGVAAQSQAATSSTRGREDA